MQRDKKSAGVAGEWRPLCFWGKGIEAPIVCLEESHPACIDRRQLCRKKFPLVGSDAPTPAREKGLQPYGRSIASRGEPKVSKGERREAGIQWIQPPKAVSDPEFRQTTSGAHGSAGRADCLPRGKSFGAPAGAYPYPIGTPTPRRGAGGERKAPCIASLKDNFAVRNFPLRGSDAPTPARGQGLQPYGALTLFFRWRKKSVQKKASGTATPGKRLLLPVLTAGLAMSRAAELASLRMQSCALGARLFPPSKWAGLFPSAAYRRSAPAQSAWGRRSPCKLGCFLWLGYFCSAKGQREFDFTLAFLSEP